MQAESLAPMVLLQVESKMWVGLQAARKVQLDLAMPALLMGWVVL